MTARLSPEREAEIRAARYSIRALAAADVDIDDLLAELAAVRAENAELQHDAAKLAALEAYGVDGWEGYNNALAAVREATGEVTR